MIMVLVLTKIISNFLVNAALRNAAVILFVKVLDGGLIKNSE